MRILDSSTVLSFRFYDRYINKLSFEDKCDFKQHFKLNDNIQLNFDNNLFILTGKKYNQFFYFDIEKKEIFKLTDTLFQHYGSNLIYNAYNNSIYCLGGMNTKKCEVYKNDQILISFSNQKNIKSCNNKWEALPEFNNFRHNFSSIIINRFIYVFFGINSATKTNNNSIERLSFIKNDIWELININQNLSICQYLNCHGSLVYNESEVLLIGGYDGYNSKDSIYVYNLFSNSVKSFNEKIPEFKKYMTFLFNKESMFLSINCFDANDTNLPNYANIDGLNRLHLVNTKRFNYEIVNLSM